jgi:CSLREA domain-containing protein
VKKTDRFCIALHIITSLILLTGLVVTPAQTVYAATYTVNSLADTYDGVCDAGNCTLREAITKANSTAAADTIQFSVSGTITITADLPSVLSAGGSLTIDGSGQNVDVSGAGIHRVLSVASGARLNLNNLDIRNGYTSVSGAGIYNSGLLTLQGGTLSHNRADDHGGAIYSTGTLTITNTAFSSNSVDIGNGGAIYIYTDTVATIKGASFYGNDSNVHGGAIDNLGNLKIDSGIFEFNSGGRGGAIYNRRDLHVQDVLFALNTADIHGGAIYNVTGGHFEFDRSKFIWNSAYDDGGGLYIFDAYGSSHIYDSILNGNIASGDGGGIKNLRGDFMIRNTEIEANQAGQNGGGVYNQEGLLYLYFVTLKSNTSDLDGGGVYNLGDLRVKYSTFESNQADGNGGGVCNGESTKISSLENSTLYDNRADLGGGVYNLAKLYLTNCTIAANRATTDGGGIIGDLDTWVHNTIVANSTSGGNCGTPHPANWGNNIDSGASCGWGSINGSKSNTNPHLGTLQFNGGWTETMALQAGSPAVDGVIYNPPNRCPEDDQRGYLRPFGLRCDIGAFERYFQVYLPQVSKY